MGVNIGAFMWLRTITSFQQVHGTSMTTAVRYDRRAIRPAHSPTHPLSLLAPPGGLLSSGTLTKVISFSSSSVSRRTLYRQGGIRRFYQGLTPALLQGPVARFGDTASNTGVLMLLDSRPETRDLPIVLKTLAGSTVSSVWRLILMP